MGVAGAIPALALGTLAVLACKKGDRDEVEFRALLARAGAGAEAPAAIDRALTAVPGSAARLLAAAHDAPGPSRWAALRVLAERDSRDAATLLAPLLWDAPMDARLPAAWRLRPAAYRSIARVGGPGEVYVLNKFHQKHDTPAGWLRMCERFDAAAAAPAPGASSSTGSGLCGPGQSAGGLRLLRRVDGVWLRRPAGQGWGPPAFAGPRADLAAGSSFDAAVTGGSVIIAGRQKDLPWTQKVGLAEIFADRDRDGIPDGTEALLATNPGAADSDGDGVADGRDAAPMARPRHDDDSRARTEIVAYLLRVEGLGDAPVTELITLGGEWETAVELPGVAPVVAYRGADDRTPRPASLVLRISAEIEAGSGRGRAEVAFTDGTSGQTGRRSLILRRIGDAWRVIRAAP